MGIQIRANEFRLPFAPGGDDAGCFHRNRTLRRRLRANQRRRAVVGAGLVGDDRVDAP